MVMLQCIITFHVETIWHHFRYLEHAQKLPKIAINPTKLAEKVDFALFLHSYEQKWDDIAW